MCCDEVQPTTDIFKKGMQLFSFKLEEIVYVIV